MRFTKEDTNVIKGIAILLMLCHHLFAFPERLSSGVFYYSAFAIGNHTLSYYIGVFGRICVSMFLFLSAYGTYLSSIGQTSDSYLTRKFVRLYGAYWRVFFIFIPISMLLRVDQVKVSALVLLQNLTGLNITYNGEWWFFTPFLILLLAFPLVKRFVDRKGGAFYSDLLITVLLNACIVSLIPQIAAQPIFSKLTATLLWTKLYLALMMLPVFLLGCLFAKYDVLSRIKTRFVGNRLSFAGALILLAAIFYIRRCYGGLYDYLLTPLLIAASIVLLTNRLLKPVYWVLQRIGEQSTVIWLTHSFYCYLWCQKLIYLPKYSALILLWLLLISYGTALLLQFFYKYLGKLLLVLKRKLAFRI